MEGGESIWVGKYNCQLCKQGRQIAGHRLPFPTWNLQKSTDIAHSDMPTWNLQKNTDIAHSAKHNARGFLNEDIIEPASGYMIELNMFPAGKDNYCRQGKQAHSQTQAYHPTAPWHKAGKWVPTPLWVFKMTLITEQSIWKKNVQFKGNFQT